MESSISKILYIVYYKVAFSCKQTLSIYGLYCYDLEVLAEQFFTQKSDFLARLQQEKLRRQVADSQVKSYFFQLDLGNFGGMPYLLVDYKS